MANIFCQEHGEIFLVYLFGTGGNALVVRKIGEGKHQEARKDFSLLMAAAFIFSVVLTIISFRSPLKTIVPQMRSQIFRQIV